jgi:Tfp pilus assembly PilM family ATPase
MTMLRRWLNNSEPIGCHIGTGRVRLAQVQGLASGEPRAVVAERELPDVPETDPAYGQAVSAVLRDMRRSAPFRGSRVVSCLPPGRARYTTMRLAPMPPAELAKAAHWKLSAELGTGPDTFKSAVLNVATIREGAKQKTEALVLCATLDRLDAHAATLTRAGLHHVAIDDPVCALARCLGAAELAGGTAPGPRVVLDLREDDAFLAVTAGAELAFVRPLELGLSHLGKTLADLLEVTPAEARALHARAVTHIRASGDDAAAPANWYSAIPFSRVRDAVADASRMYGRELARQVALSMYYYANASATAAPETGVVVSDRTIDPAALEAVTVQSGIDLAAFDPAVDGGGFWTGLKSSIASPDVGPWVTALGLSLYEHGLPVSKEVA